MGAETDLKKVCESLDQVTIDFFDTLDSLYQSQAKLEVLMRGGFLSMSRARYSMGGTRNIGALQFAKNEMEMEALSVVDVSGDEELSNEKGDHISWNSLEIKLVEKQAGTVKNVDRESAEKRDELRQRKGQKVSTKDKDSDAVETIGMQKVTDQKEEKLQKKEIPTLKDPLTLFGVLVSPHLRQCQASFKQAVAVAVEIANLKNKLQGLQQNFQQLMTQKKTLSAS